MSQLGSLGHLPNSNFTGALITPADSSAHPLTSVFTPVQRVVFEIPAANTGTITLTINGQTFKTFANGVAAEYIHESAPGSTFDLAAIQYTSSNGASSVLRIFYQP